MSRKNKNKIRVSLPAGVNKREVQKRLRELHERGASENPYNVAEDIAREKDAVGLAGMAADAQDPAKTIT